MAQETGNNLNLRRFKCAKCKGPLDNAVQLPACLHILCKGCLSEDEPSFRSSTMNCPNCGKENAKPSILHRISGIELQTAAPIGGGEDGHPCGYEASHEKAIYFCFLCSINMCRNCRSSHFLDHSPNIMLLTPPRHLQVFDGAASAAAENYQYESIEVDGADEVDGAGSAAASFTRSMDLGGAPCPKCGGQSCDHISAFESLLSEPSSRADVCEVQGHEGQKKKYFCLNKGCWKPVCGDCSERGSHKLHHCEDLIYMRGYLEKLLGDIRGRLGILRFKAERDHADEEKAQEDLRSHVEEVSSEMYQRKCKVLEDITYAYNMAMDDAEHKGRNIVRIYKQKRKQTKDLCEFLQALHGAVDLKVDQNLNIPQYVHFLHHLRDVEKAVDELNSSIRNQANPQEYRLTVSGMDDSCSSVFKPIQVSRECKKPPVLYYFQFDTDVSLVHSIVVRASDYCILTCQLASQGGSRSSDGILHCKLKSDGKPDQTMSHIPRGKYYMTQLPSGEIVAAYADKDNYALKYCRDDEPLLDCRGGGRVDCSPFESITEQLSLEPRGIAATSQNTVLLSVDLNEAGKEKIYPQGAKLLMLMSLQGKILKEYAGVGTDSLSLSSVAVSDKGEVCACDPSSSTLVLLDHNLQNVTRLQFCWPTSMSRVVLRTVAMEDKPPSDGNISFRPEGVCYDSHGRIIVADSTNHAVVRLSPIVAPSSCSAGGQYKIEPLIVAMAEDDPELKYFRFPHLVALDKDSRRLWVVCQQYIYIFTYGE